MKLSVALVVAVSGMVSLAAAEAEPPESRQSSNSQILGAEARHESYGLDRIRRSTPEPVPVEIIGLWKNAWGPKQDIILGKMGGKALRTNVAGGMSGSPVYVDGKLVGAVALRLSVFSPDAICGITPIELMLEINDFDKSRPSDAQGPGQVPGARIGIEVPGDLLAQAVAAGASGSAAASAS